MKIYSIHDKEFAEYGKPIKVDFTELLNVLSVKECPSNGTVYVPSDSDLEDVAVFEKIKLDYFGGMPIQIGYCNGHNNMLNCVEYHKDSEINICESDTVLLLGKLQDIVDNTYDTSLITAFKIPAGEAVELYATTLHYAPCAEDGKGFRVAVVLPKGTNLERPQGATDPLLLNKNKWLLAHSSAPEAKNGAYVGLLGENIKI